MHSQKGKGGKTPPQKAVPKNVLGTATARLKKSSPWSTTMAAQTETRASLVSLLLRAECVLTAQKSIKTGEKKNNSSVCPGFHAVLCTHLGPNMQSVYTLNAYVIQIKCI